MTIYQLDILEVTTNINFTNTFSGTDIYQKFMLVCGVLFALL